MHVSACLFSLAGASTMPDPETFLNRATRLRTYLADIAQEARRLEEERMRLVANLRSATARRAEIAAGFHLRQSSRTATTEAESLQQTLAEIDRYLDRLHQEDQHLLQRESAYHERVRHITNTLPAEMPDTESNLIVRDLLASTVRQHAQAHQCVIALEAQLQQARECEYDAYAHLLDQLAICPPGAVEILVPWLETILLPPADQGNGTFSP
jgi:chromosome segregation ATPase